MNLSNVPSYVRLDDARGSERREARGKGGGGEGAAGELRFPLLLGRPRIRIEDAAEGYICRAKQTGVFFLFAFSHFFVFPPSPAFFFFFFFFFSDAV